MALCPISLRASARNDVLGLPGGFERRTIGFPAIRRPNQIDDHGPRTFCRINTRHELRHPRHRSQHLFRGFRVSHADQIRRCRRGSGHDSQRGLRSRHARRQDRARLRLDAALKDLGLPIEGHGLRPDTRRDDRAHRALREDHRRSPSSPPSSSAAHSTPRCTMRLARRMA